MDCTLKTEMMMVTDAKKIQTFSNYQERLCLAPYQCPSCKKLFYTTSDLDRHLNNATDC